MGVGGGLAVTQDEVEHPLPSMPCLRAQPDSVATQSKHVANVLSEYVSSGGGQETEPEAHSKGGSEGVSPENCLGTSANEGEVGGRCWATGLIHEV